MAPALKPFGKIFKSTVTLSWKTLFGLMIVQIVTGLVPHISETTWSLAQAAEEKEESKYAKAKTKKRHAVSKNCGKKLETIQLEIEAERWSAAKTQLLGSLNSGCTSSYEKSQVWNFMAYVNYSQDNFKEAIKSYKKVIAEPETDERLKTSVYYSIAQLYFATEDYANAARNLETWMAESAVVGPDGKVMLAQAYYQLNKKRQALALVNEAITEWVGKGNVPKENWWGLQRVIHYENKNYKKVVSVLKKLLKHYPKYSYWRQLGGMYAELGQDINQLVATELVYLAQGFDKERELLSLAYLFTGADAPYLGARIVEKGIKAGTIKKTAKNMEFLGHAWTQAQDGKKARPALEAAAGLSGQGKIWARLASVYLDIGENAKAVQASRNAINKGGLKRKDLTYMVLGNAQLNLHCYQAAVSAFNKAAQDKRSTANAKKWVQYSTNEGSRRDKLREMGANISGCSKA